MLFQKLCFLIIILRFVQIKHYCHAGSTDLYCIQYLIHYRICFFFLRKNLHNLQERIQLKYRINPFLFTINRIRSNTGKAFLIITEEAATWKCITYRHLGDLYVCVYLVAALHAVTGTGCVCAAALFVRV